MKDNKKRSLLTNENHPEVVAGNNHRDGHREHLEAAADQKSSSLYSLNNPSIIKRYSFDDNGGSYQGL